MKRDTDQLRHLIQLGVPLGGSLDDVPLLGYCAERRWEEGFDLLLSAGAPTQWDILQGEKCLPGRYGSSMPKTLLQAMAEDGFAHGVEALWDSSEPLDAQAAIPLMESASCWEFLDRRGLAHRMDRDKTAEIASSLMHQCLDPDSTYRPLLSRLATSCSWTTKQRTALWLSAVWHGSPSLMEFSSKLGLAPHPDGSVHATPLELYDDSYFDTIVTFDPWFEGDGATGDEPTAEGKRKRTFTLAELACASINQSAEGEKNFVALCELPEFVEQIGVSPFALQCIAQSGRGPDFYKNLEERGIELSTLVDLKRRNPLHRDVAGMHPRTHIEKMASLCEPLIHQRDKQGKMPIDFAKTSAKAELAVVFDKIGMKAGLGGKRGSKAKQTSRRL